jgi:hypothetical protein
MTACARYPPIPAIRSPGNSQIGGFHLARKKIDDSPPTQQQVSRSVPPRYRQQIRCFHAHATFAANQPEPDIL